MQERFTAVDGPLENPCAREGLDITKAGPADASKWDAYVNAHPKATMAHLFGWKGVIEKTYGHETVYLMAVQRTPKKDSDPDLRGLIPLVHLRHLLFGNELVSMPFLDTGGILADNHAAESALWSAALRLAESKKAALELRQHVPLEANAFSGGPTTTIRTDKARMLLPLPASSHDLMASFKSKLRSQIRKPIKEGLKPFMGAMDMLDEFYWVFSKNMRELGSPVHAKALFLNIIETFPEQARIVLIKNPNGAPMAAGLVFGFKKTLHNPWASFLREHSAQSPNMLLYWHMLAYACEHAYETFDFGRSSREEGTYRFKAQWAALDTPLYWYRVSFKGKQENPSQNRLFQKASQSWRHLPVPLANFIGPRIRKYIGL